MTTRRPTRKKALRCRVPPYDFIKTLKKTESKALGAIVRHLNDIAIEYGGRLDQLQEQVDELQMQAEEAQELLGEAERQTLTDRILDILQPAIVEAVEETVEEALQPLHEGLRSRAGELENCVSELTSARQDLVDRLQQLRSCVEERELRAGAKENQPT